MRCTLKKKFFESTYETQSNMSCHWIELYTIVLDKTLNLKLARRITNYSCCLIPLSDNHFIQKLKLVGCGQRIYQAN